MAIKGSPQSNQNQAGNQLSYIAGLTTSIANVLQDRRNGRDEPNPSSMQAAVAIVALVSLAIRGTQPDRLKGNFAGRLLSAIASEIFNANRLASDSSQFSQHLTAFICEAELERYEDCIEQLLKVLKQFSTEKTAAPILEDPLLAGWSYQCALMARNNYSFLRQHKSLQSIGQITQWFTPSWISEFLIDRSFSTCEKTSPTFLDASCGAGHILLPAFHRLVHWDQHWDRRRLAGTSGEVVADVLKDQLFGIDIDPSVTALAGFGIYLACLDAIGPAPLPIPSLFTFSSSSAGSLELGIEGRAVRPSLARIDRVAVPLTSLPKTFDVQACNPPYLSHRLMPKEIGNFLKQHYPGSHYDLYAAFLELGIRLMSDSGRFALICQQSFLTTTRYETLRRALVERCHIDSIVQLGAGSFASRAGEKVSNAIISLSKKNGETLEEAGNHHNFEQNKVSIFKAVNRTDKSSAQESGIAAQPEIRITEKSLLSVSRSIPGFPIAPFCPPEIAKLFTTLPPLSDPSTGVTLSNGLFTCDNERFVKHFTDVLEHEKKSYVPYDKGGGQKWFSTTPHMLKWIDDGEEIRNFRAARGQARALPGERFYFQPGITYSYIGTKGFKARLLSPGTVFDIASSALFTNRIDLNYLLGFLNSALVRFILGTLNPTVNFQIGDLRRIPFCEPPKELEEKISTLTKEAVELARSIDAMNPLSPACKGFSGHDYNELLRLFDKINAREKAIQKSIDEMIFDLYSVPQRIRTEVEEDDWVKHGHDKLGVPPSLKSFSTTV